MMEASVDRFEETRERFNPFPGLRPFEADEDHLFFGRERETDELLRRLRSNRFVSVLGTSGSGKSSLVRSGLIPSLYSGFMVEAGSDWRVAVMRPGEDPIGNLAAALNTPEVLGQHEEMADTNRMLLETTLRRSTLGLADCVKHARLSEHENVLVVVDQFEELFRFKETRQLHGARDEAVAFAKLLLDAASQQQVPVYVVITMRSDFVGDCMEYPGLPEAINEGQYLIPRMTREELRSAITGPVAVGGGAIAPRLVARLLNDVGDDPDQLPVLQHALMRTWDHWEQDRGDSPLDLEHYESIGTMKEALDRHAEEAFGELRTERAQTIAEHLFKALTDTRIDDRGVRRPTPVEDVSAITRSTDAEVIEVVEAFRRPGRSFLMPPVGAELSGASVIDLSHESLMRLWRRLTDWVQEEQASGKAFRRLCRAALRHDRGQAGLWVEPELSLGIKWREDNRPTAAWGTRYTPDFDLAMRFLQLSKDAHDQRIAEEERERRAKLLRARILAGVLGSAAVVTLFFGVFAYRAGQVAKKEAQKAQAVSGFLVDLFAVVDPEEAQGNTITAREILDEGARKVETQLADQPAVQATLMGTMGKVYGSLGLYDEAESLLNKAVATARGSVGQDAPETLEASDHLAGLYLDQGRFQESQNLYNDVIETRRRVLGPEHPDTLRSMTGLAEVYSEQGFHPEAEATARRALEAQRRALGDEHAETLASMHHLGASLAQLGRFAEAEELLETALETRGRTLGEGHPDTLASLGALGGVYSELGRFDEAEELYQTNLDNRRRVFGDEHAKTYAAIALLAQLDMERGNFKQAEQRRRQVLEGRRRLLGDEHPSTLETLSLLSWTLHRQARSEEAQEIAQSAYDIAVRVLGAEHPKTLDIAVNLSSAYSGIGRQEVAEELLLHVVEARRKLYGDAHPQTLTARNNLAVVYDNWGREDRTEEIARENYALAKEILGEDNPQTLFYLKNVVIILNSQQRRDEAAELGQEMLAAHRRVLGDDSPETFRAIIVMANLHRSQNRLDETEELLREAHAGRERVLGQDNPDTLQSKYELYSILQQRGRFEECEPIGLELVEDVRRVWGEEHDFYIGGHEMLGWLYRQMGQPEKQLEYQTIALGLRKRIAEKEDATAKVRIDYANALVNARPELQNPPEAIRFASKANEMTEWGNRNYVAVLAEAYAKDGQTDRALDTIDRALALVPADDIGARNWLEGRKARFLEVSGDTSAMRKATADRLARQEEEASKPDASPRTRNDYAWALLTAYPLELRDPQKSLKLALELNQETEYSRANLLQLLALAYHLNGEREKAVETQQKALEHIDKDQQFARPNNENRYEVYGSPARPADLDLERVLTGTWVSKFAGLEFRVEIRREGDHFVAINLADTPDGRPIGSKFYRFDSKTGRLEIQEVDAGFTNRRWEEADWILTEDGHVLLWNLRGWFVIRWKPEDTSRVTQR